MTGDETTDSPTSVAVLGTGAIGTAVTRALRRAGFRVIVWNRTPERARAALDHGARRAETATDALDADIAILALSDGQAVLDVLGAVATVLAGKVVVALGTVSPHEAEAAADLAERAGGDYLGVGLQHGPEQIGSFEVQLPVGGRDDVLDRARPVLEVIGSVRHVGTGAGAAAMWDLALFGIWYDAHLGLLRAFDNVRSAGVDIAAFAEAARVQLQYVVEGAEGAATELVSHQYPAGPADLRQHAPVVEALADLRQGSTLGDGGLVAVQRLLEVRIGEGWADAGLTALLAGSREQAGA
ncbi:NAD(P)-binding domain-containing protein [Blastococcus xanthinilyticus]|uniref:6-phosphogluconate dehydrogenase-like protein n=1 Tax=Blastococcus xanthinilyticus TaxID=1564164 RepID=A0A5S5CSB2_9ACTN|nr:NAD(P)-binding domain-containing protein [Blastococcus xanthinilyticus]TYP86737.1 6-phosphogluconate dehydrogenase-like protein [Blastococcus xanthinilyticus]